MITNPTQHPNPASPHPTNPLNPSSPPSPVAGQVAAGAGGQRTNRQHLLTAVAGGVLAITAFLGGAAVGHAWSGTRTTGPGNGGFGPGNVPNGPGNGFPGQNQLPGQTNPQDPTNPQGQTQQSGSDSPDTTVRQVAWINIPAKTANAPSPLELYGLWRLPARVPDAATVRGKLEPA